MKQIHLNIRKFRELKNITRKEMAERLGITGSGYYKIERGEIDPSISRLLEIARILGVNVNQMLEFDADEIFLSAGHRTPQAAPAPQTDYREKYIKMLEEEVERLRGELKKR